MERLADLAGLHRTSVGLIFAGKRGLTIATAARMSQALNLSLSQVLAEAERLASADGTSA